MLLFKSVFTIVVLCNAFVTSKAIDFDVISKMYIELVRQEIDVWKWFYIVNYGLNMSRKKEHNVCIAISEWLYDQ